MRGVEGDLSHAQSSFEGDDVRMLQARFQLSSALGLQRETMLALGMEKM